MCSYYFHPFAPFATSDVHVLTVFSSHIARILYFHVTDPRVFLPRFLFPLILACIFFMHICLIYWHTRRSSRRRNRCKRLGGPSGRGLAFALTLSTSSFGREPATRLLSRLSGRMGWADVDWEVRKFGRTRWGAEGGRRQVGRLGRFGKG